MNTRFYPLKDYEGRYEISKAGVVRGCNNIKADKLGRVRDWQQKDIKIIIDKRSGYPVVKLTTIDGEAYGTRYVHRLLALTFIPNRYDKPLVNHRDGNKLNYTLSNLEWSTHSENHRHAIALKLIKLPYENKVPVFDRCSGKTYPSMRRSARDLKIDYNDCKKMLRGIIANTTCLELLEGSTTPPLK